MFAGFISSHLLKQTVDASLDLKSRLLTINDMDKIVFMGMVNSQHVLCITNV